jgi:hypothetical protein
MCGCATSPRRAAYRSSKWFMPESLKQGCEIRTAGKGYNDTKTSSFEPTFILTRKSFVTGH